MHSWPDISAYAAAGQVLLVWYTSAEVTIAACCFTMQGTLVGNKVYLFGGEDAARRPQGDLFVLDLADMEWQSPEVTGAPTSTQLKACNSILRFLSHAT